MDNWRTDWVNKKTETALRLAKGECGGGYGEAMLIICSAISAFAQELWPGRNIDRRRFVEVIQKHSCPDLCATKISIPVLAKILSCSGKQQERAMGKCIVEEFLSGYHRGEILTDKNDQEETVILEGCDIDRKLLRKCSYANLLYTEVRSGYAHQYAPGKNADSWPITKDAKDAKVSYVNEIGRSYPYIHFHVEWAAELAKSIAKNIDEIAKTKRIPLEIPKRWWVDG